jgi:L-galactose dehydrogenase
MQFSTLGRTGLSVSILGLGGGGLSRFGLTQGASVDDAVRLIRHGLDRGINFIDLGGSIYGTDEVVARALNTCRSQVILSTKANLGPSTWVFEGNRTASRASARIGELTSFVTSGRVLENRLNASLRRLKTDYIDVFNLHAVTPKQYDIAIDRVLPTLIRLREKGKIRWIGITEAFAIDPTHKMLDRSASNDLFDTIMIGFNILNPSGRSIAAQAPNQGRGVIAMYAISRRLRDERSLQSLLNYLLKRGALATRDADARSLMTLLEDHHIGSLAEAALRFCRHESGADVVLTGTGRIDHLEKNIAAIEAAPLPQPVLAEFRRRFADIGFLTGD